MLPALQKSQVKIDISQVHIPLNQNMSKRLLAGGTISSLFKKLLIRGEVWRVQ